MMNDKQAKAMVDAVGDEMGLSPIERLAVRIVAKHETQNGAGWDAGHLPFPRPEFGAGSNNMGAVTTTSTAPGSFFIHGDSRFDPETGKVVQYQTKFSRWPTPQDGFRELARVLLFTRDGQRRANVARALELGSLLELATAMRMNRYFLGTKPLKESIEIYRQALERRYKEISAVTGEKLFPKLIPGSPEVSGSGLVSQSSPSVPRFLQQLSASLPVLRRGARGDLVGVMQFELGKLEPDESFGPLTEARLIEFQQSVGMTSEVAPSGKPYPLGVCGVRTWASLFAVTPEDIELYPPPTVAGLELAWSEGAQDEDERTWDYVGPVGPSVA